MNDRDITTAFNQFAGREVHMRDQVSYGTESLAHHYMLRDQDSAINAMKSAAFANKANLCVYVRDPVTGTETGQVFTAGTESKTTVVTHVDQSPDGKWRVSNKFDVRIS